MPVPKGAAIGRIAIVASALWVWQYMGDHSARFKFVLATPTEVADQLWRLSRSGELLKDMAVTGAEALGGLILGTVFGTLFGLLLWLSRAVASLTRPLVLALGSFPIFAVAPLMIVWFGIGIGMKVAFAAMATVFVAFGQAFSGAQSVSTEYLEVMKGLGASPWSQFRKVVVPASLEWVLAALRVNTGLCLLGAFIGEFVAAKRGLGQLIMAAAGLYNVPKALAGAIGIVVLATAFNWMAGLVEMQRSTLSQYLSVPKRVRRPFWAMLQENAKSR
jgi:NitT/TauT family transport system permease protein